MYLVGKRKLDILREYDLHVITLDRRIKQHEGTSSFKESDNRTPEEKELIELRKLNRQKFENDILKQVELIKGRKSK